MRSKILLGVLVIATVAMVLTQVGKGHKPTDQAPSTPTNTQQVNTTSGFSTDIPIDHMWQHLRERLPVDLAQNEDHEQLGPQLSQHFVHGRMVKRRQAWQAEGFDKNQDHNLDPDMQATYKAWRADFARTRSFELREHLQQADINDDGILSVSEMHGPLTGFKSAYSMKATDNDTYIAKRDVVKAYYFDANGDGLLDDVERSVANYWERMAVRNKPIDIPMDRVEITLIN